MSLVKAFSVTCMLCGRASGQLRDGVFLRLPGAPPPKAEGRHYRCGYCSGNLYLEPDDSALPLDPALQAVRKRRLAS